MNYFKAKKRTVIGVFAALLSIGAALLTSCDAMMGESLPDYEQTGSDQKKGGGQSGEDSDSQPPAPAQPPGLTTLGLTTLAEVEAAIVKGPAYPVPLYIDANPAFTWAQLLSAIGTAGKTVALDLSATTLAVTLKADGSGVFDSRNPVGGKPYNTGEPYITKLILPDAATAIAQGVTGKDKNTDSTFARFTGLVEVSADKVTIINPYAFDSCPALEKASFLAVTSIGQQAFEECPALAELYLPADPPALPVEGGGTSRLFQIESSDNSSGTLTIYVDGAADAVDNYKWEWEVDEDTPATSTDIYGGGGHNAVNIVPLR
ncbi:MAG: leucine-rich repeat domain-containing protein [Spirochaetaceae bacterium]|jgi:hypothetical protein|nr:leucine-rich repeat domain-containing protein [Spirochaetaceae bacterium]